MSEIESRGSIKIADDVVATIAALAAADTKGVSGMSGGIAEGIARRVSGRNSQKGVSVEVGQIETAIGVRIIVQFGEKIDAVCRLLQQNVREAVESMTGLKVVEVNVKVEGVEFEKLQQEAPIVEEAVIPLPRLK
jgi:uncharacterized alkaline shock family protein YloU